MCKICVKKDLPSKNQQYQNIYFYNFLGVYISYTTIIDNKEALNDLRNTSFNIDAISNTEEGTEVINNLKTIYYLFLNMAYLKGKLIAVTLRRNIYDIKECYNFN